MLNDSTDGRAFSVILLAKNMEGFNNLSRLVTLAHEHDPKAPKITKSQLQAHAEGLICLSFSVVGELCTLLLESKDTEARKVSDWYQSVFGNDYFYELQNHGLPKEAIAMNKLLNLAYQSKVPVVLSNDCHYLLGADSTAIDALNCLRKGIKMNHPRAKRFACNEYYFKKAGEMRRLYDFPPQLITNTVEIAHRVELDLTSLIPNNPGLLSAFKQARKCVRDYDPKAIIRYIMQVPHLRIELQRGTAAVLFEHLKSELRDYELVPYAEYKVWAPSELYGAVLKLMGVEKGDRTRLCKLIPDRAHSLVDAILISTDFSLFATEDYLYSKATDIADTIIKTIMMQRISLDSIALIPKAAKVPLFTDSDGKHGCQFDRVTLNRMGIVTIEGVV